MACGCGTDHNDGKAVVDRLKTKGFEQRQLKQSYDIPCECGKHFTMVTHRDQCPHCGMVYGVTPCSQHDPANIKAAGINYA
uniref:hypothetical protein n=1 Tax=Thaumasiovibrio occultus TaxID=1891184 RepID=UPI000B34F6E5|nr:hypothetical protein [Thaumasiovibrio occultus]